MKKSFLIYHEYKEHLELLSDAELGQFLRGVMAYEITGEVPKFKGMLQMAFSFVKGNLDRDRVKYEETCDKNRENGKKGGAPKGNNNASKQPKTTERLKKQPKQADNDNDIDNDIEIDIDNDIVIVNEIDNEARETTTTKTKNEFIAPKEKEVEEYCKSRGNSIDPQQFIDYYAARNWLLKEGIKMDDWRAAVRTWEKNNGNALAKSRGSPVKSRFHNFTGRGRPPPEPGEDPEYDRALDKMIAQMDAMDEGTSNK